MNLIIGNTGAPRTHDIVPKRLLYVALTRARDRVYLSATVQNGVCRMGRGSLGEVLPTSLKALFGAAAGEAAVTIGQEGFVN